MDAADLDGAIFPKAGHKGKKASQVITNKSELLFVWRMLDLLRVGGRCAVIVPEGVLFGNTEGHVRLRRELLTEHKVEAVISLPAGVFQPYTGVKTSILVFQKETRKDDRNQWKPVDAPRTQQVWFYEVEQETFTLDAKRNERRGQDNDLWDMLAKYRLSNEPDQAERDYFQPGYNTERWRMVDAHTLKVFSDEAEVVRWKDQVAAINELFANLPANPEQALAQIEATQQSQLVALAQVIFNKSIADELAKAKLPKDGEQRSALTDKLLKKAASDFRSLCEKHKVLFDPEEKVAYPFYHRAYKSAADVADASFRPCLLAGEAIAAEDSDEDQVKHQLAAIAREYAHLDGYDVMLRELESLRREGVLKNAKHWVAPVRTYTEDPDWQSADDTPKGSHDEAGNPRPQYLAANQLYDEQGNLNEALLDPDCIEARGWNLSASQYKPFSFEAMVSDKSVAEMIRELKQKEGEIMQGLDRLLALVEGTE